MNELSSPNEESLGSAPVVKDSSTRRTFIKRAAGVCIALTVLDLVPAYSKENPNNPGHNINDNLKCLDPGTISTVGYYDHACTTAVTQADQNCGNGADGRAADPDAHCSQKVVDAACGASFGNAPAVDIDESCPPVAPPPGSKAHSDQNA